LAAVIVVVGVIVFLDNTQTGLSVRLALGLSTGPSGHWVQTVVPEATGVIQGERVTAAGETAGYVVSADVTKHGRAHIVMDIDNSVWPLPKDTTLTLRMGGTIKYTDRFIAVTRGRSRQDFSDGSYVPASQFVVPVEYDQLFNAFDPSTRAGLRSFLDNGGQALQNAAPSLNKALGDSAPALGQAAAVFSDLGYNTRALRTLVNSTDDVVNAVARANPGLRQLLQGAANTFSAVASQSNALQTTLSDAPAAFQNLGHALYHASGTLTNVSVLSDRLNPGVTRLRELATPLDDALRTVVDISPDAIATLNTVRDAGPSLDSLLSEARTILMPRVQSIGQQAATQLGCIRPYTPEIVGTVSTWGSFWSQGDSTDTLLDGLFGPLPFPNATPLSPAQAGALDPGLKDQFPQVPGMILNQPWFQPQCGITANDLKLADDPETHTIDPAYDAAAVPYGAK
jgi:phospholipid/cholesterol/gamma-HCH transport system substrate-binding protein